MDLHSESPRDSDGGFAVIVRALGFRNLLPNRVYIYHIWRQHVHESSTSPPELLEPTVTHMKDEDYMGECDAEEFQQDLQGLLASPAEIVEHNAREMRNEDYRTEFDAAEWQSDLQLLPANPLDIVELDVTQMINEDLKTECDADELHNFSYDTERTVESSPSSSISGMLYINFISHSGALYNKFASVVQVHFKSTSSASTSTQQKST